MFKEKLKKVIANKTVRQCWAEDNITNHQVFIFEISILSQCMGAMTNIASPKKRRDFLCGLESGKNGLPLFDNKHAGIG